MGISIAVCDDSKEYSEIVTEIIKRIVNNRTNVNTFNSGHDLVQAFKENKFDIIFLDMEMPEINGIETGLKIREMSDKAIIFYLTSHKEYAYESYRVKARDYLLKPVSLSIIEKVLNECLLELEGSLNYLDVKDIKGIIHRIPIDDITHVLRKKEDRKLHIYCLDNKEIITSQTLESIERALIYKEHIVRASKSCLVNMVNVREIRKNVIYFSNEAREEASRRCLSELVNKFKLKKLAVKI
ncbi:LytTR family DNA-binding domain-containing protein [Sedimentibacter sp.]|uniref:LytR/AlgR family response regulator transcription factor n=1 Tax=Sedimentibacter sp. TaxID=1960295 RepID=UPI0028A60D50|nr:LytTR family DNA-binding domain-containing protein [Sedimentibacter sp.]